MKYNPYRLPIRKGDVIYASSYYFIGITKVTGVKMGGWITPDGYIPYGYARRIIVPPKKGVNY